MNFNLYFWATCIMLPEQFVIKILLYSGKIVFVCKRGLAAFFNNWNAHDHLIKLRFLRLLLTRELEILLCFSLSASVLINWHCRLNAPWYLLYLKTLFTNLVLYVQEHLLFIGPGSKSLSSLAQLHESDQLLYEVFSLGSAMLRVVRQTKAFHSVLRGMQSKHWNKSVFIYCFFIIFRRPDKTNLSSYIVLVKCQ